MNAKNNPSEKKFQDQKGIAQCSVLLCPRIYLNHYTTNEKMKTFKEDEGPWALAKVLQVPNHIKMIDTYKLQYHNVHTEMDGWVSELPKNKFVKKGLQGGVKRANKQNWRLKMTPKQNSTNKHPSHKQASDKQSSKQTSDKQPSLVKKKKTQQILTTPITNNGTCLLSGILEEEHDGSEFLQSINHDSDSYRDGDDNEDSLMDALEDTKKQRMTTSPNTVGQYSGINQSPPQGDQSNYDDEDSECNIMNSVIEPIPINVEDRIQPDDSTKIAEDDEKDYLGEEWQWNNWEEHDIDTEIEGPKEDDHYSGPCGLTSGVSKKFVTVVPIHQFNFMARKKFHLAPNASFDEGSIPMRSCFCPARQYNKDKAAKYRVDFFICYGCRYLFMDNRYAAPQLLALMLTNYNIRAVGSCKANR